MYIFIAITMLTGLIEKNSIQDYSSTDPLLITPIFGQYLTRNRYHDILRFMHFANNEVISNTNRLEKIKSIIDDFKRKFPNCVNTQQRISVSMKVSCYGKGDLDSSSISRLSAIDSESNYFSSLIVKPNSS